jgi:hypothetical protein
MARAAIRTRGSAGSVPANVIPPSLSGTQTVTSTLTCNDGTWVGLPPLTITRQWMRGASTVIPGQTGPTYVLAVADQGTTVRCSVTATNTQLGWSTTRDTPPTNTIP